MVTVGLFPGESLTPEERLNEVNSFWDAVFAGDDPGEATWAELQKWHGHVQGALAKVPADLASAESITAYAAILMTGLSSL